MISYANAHNGVILLTWDEPASTGLQPFLVMGPNTKPGYGSNVHLDLSSVTKSIQRMLNVSPAEGVPYLGHAADAATNDISDYFLTGKYP
ncbi:hypothetical protein BH11MYX1_BH11MYX1_15320 [soil metagenome]